MEEIFGISSIIAFSVLFFWEINSKRKEYSYILNPKNEHAVIKLAFYDFSYRKECLEKLRSVRARLKIEETDREKGKIIIRLYPVYTSPQYIERLIEKIEHNFYAKELSLLSKEDQRLDNWDQF